MTHTHTPLKKKGYIKSHSENFHRQALQSDKSIADGGIIISVFAATKENTKEFSDSVMACVNACEGMEDPAKDTEIAQLKARVEQLEQPWISINRLPKTNDLYLTIGWNGQLPYAARFTDGEWFETEYDFYKNEFTNVSKYITHWMPIVNPPKPQP